MSSFRQIDLVRAVRGCEKAGLTIQRVELCAETGRMIIVTGGDAKAQESARDAREVVGERLRRLAEKAHG